MVVALRVLNTADNDLRCGRAGHATQGGPNSTDKRSRGLARDFVVRVFLHTPHAVCSTHAHRPWGALE